MTDADQIREIERYLSIRDGKVYDAIRWLLADWRRLKALQSGEAYLCNACWEEFKEPAVDAAIAKK